MELAYESGIERIAVAAHDQLDRERLAAAKASRSHEKVANKKTKLERQVSDKLSCCHLQ